MASGASRSAIRFEVVTSVPADGRNSGQLFGQVSLSQDPDRFDDIGAGVAIHLIQGLGGNDTLIGGEADEKPLNGSAGSATLLAGGGSDILRGRTGDDHIAGVPGRAAGGFAL